MAARSGPFGGSVKESDFYYDLPCSPCEKDGKNVEDIKYCTDCEENMCAKCLKNHNRVSTTRGHEVLDQVQTIQGQTKQLPSQRCSKHGGKIINVFCPKHDAVGCSTCVAVDHSSCNGKKFITDTSVGIKTSQELKQLETELKTLKSKFDSLKKLKRDNLQRLKQDKDALMKQIQFVRKKMSDQLDKMEKELIDEAETKFKQRIEALNTRITEVDTMLARVNQAMGQMKSDNNDADIFVSCKVVKQEISDEIYPVHEIIEELSTEHSLELHTDEYINLLMEGKRMFASIKEKYTILDVEYKRDINIRTCDDMQNCLVFAMCALPDGCLLFSDYNNKKLKKLNIFVNNLSTLIDLPDNPFGLCVVDNNRLAVALPNQKKIQIVSLENGVTLVNSFSVGDRCRGVAHCDGLLYVCCGGSLTRNEGCGHVEVYSCNGEILRCLYEEFGCPSYISVVNDVYDTTIYTGDSCIGVQMRGVDGVVKHIFPTVLNTSLPFCVIGTDQICIGESSTGNINLQTCTVQRILIENKDLNGNPRCIYFDKMSSQLIVCANVNDDDCTIKVFKIKM